jgi:hypothetical protein
MNMNKKYIYKNQSSLWGEPECIGFGTDEFYVKEIDRKLANNIIIKNHYSKKTFNNTYINLGVFYNNELKGVLQYGHLMNPSSSKNIVKNSNSSTCLELNRMWIDDNCIKYAESQAISCSIKYIKKKHKKIKWIQSFADERCGGLGIVYQACSFYYFGEHTSEFYILDNVYYHSTYFTNTKGNSASKSEKAKLIRKRIAECKKIKLRQFRYIKFIDKREKKNCFLKEHPYPKHYKENKIN